MTTGLFCNDLFKGLHPFTVFQSNQDQGIVNMKGSLQRSFVMMQEESPFQWDFNARSINSLSTSVVC